MRRNPMVAGLATLVSALVVLLPACGTINPQMQIGSQADTERTAIVDDGSGPREMSVVDGGDPADPAHGEELNQDPRTPVVRDGVITNTWDELEDLLGSDAEYTSCVNNTIETNWTTDVPTFKASEAGNVETRFILVVNSTVDDPGVREILRKDGVPNVDRMKIIRADGIINTRGFDDGQPGCEEFFHTKPQVRMTLGVVKYENGQPVGLLEDRGVFVDCHNPWRLANEVPATTSAPIPTTTAPPPPEGQGGCVECGEEQPDCEGGCATITTQPPCQSCSTTTLPPKKSYSPPPGQEKPVDNSAILEDRPADKPVPLQPDTGGQDNGSAGTAPDAEPAEPDRDAPAAEEPAPSQHDPGTGGSCPPGVSSC